MAGEKASLKASDEDGIIFDGAVQVCLGQPPVRAHLQLPSLSSGSWTGGKLWPSGLVLAEWLARQPLDFLQGARVLELGCGVAPLPSLVAVRRGAATVLATDGAEAAVVAARATFERCIDVQDCVRNGSLQCECLDWGMAERAAPLGTFDVILVADGVYTESAAATLAACINRCWADSSDYSARCSIYTVLPDERIGAAEFCRHMRRQGFRAEALDISGAISRAVDGRTFVQALEGRDLTSVMEVGSARKLRLIRWCRDPALQDDGPALENHFLGAVAAAEDALEARLAAAGYCPEE